MNESELKSSSSQIKSSELIYEVKQLPIFQHRMYSSESEARNCPRGDVRLVEDAETGLIHNEAFRPELVVYDEHYQCEQAVSSIFRDHLEVVAAIVNRNMSNGPIVEIGCGKGYFLERLSSLGLEVIGFDPAYEGKNPRIVKKYFSQESGHVASSLILRHVLEHIQNPFEFLNMLRNSNGGSGKVYIEVPCFDWICNRRAWFDIFYEHVNYFRLSDFQRMFGKIYESGRLFGDQYLYVLADLASLSAPKRLRESKMEFPTDFLRTVEIDFGKNSKTIVWGGASKGVIFSLLRERVGRRVDAVIDINPGKQGKYLPATGLRVSRPEEVLPTLPPHSNICVMNSNYISEIKQMSNNAFNYIGVDDA